MQWIPFVAVSVESLAIVAVCGKVHFHWPPIWRGIYSAEVRNKRMRDTIRISRESNSSCNLLSLSSSSTLKEFSFYRMVAFNSLRKRLYLFGDEQRDQYFNGRLEIVHVTNLAQVTDDA